MWRRFDSIVLAAMLPWAFGCGTPDPVASDAAQNDTANFTVIVDEEITEAVACEACGGDCLEETVSYATRRHTDLPVVYTDWPAVGGDHDACWLDFVQYDEPVDEARLVHSLEHGTVVLLYNCPAGCADDLAQLSSYAEQLNWWWIVAPDTRMTAQFAVLTWGHRLLLDCVDETTIDAFVVATRGQSPELTDEPPSTSCQ